MLNIYITDALLSKPLHGSYSGYKCSTFRPFSQSLIVEQEEHLNARETCPQCRGRGSLPRRHSFGSSRIPPHSSLVTHSSLGRRDYVTSQKNVCVGGYGRGVLCVLCFHKLRCSCSTIQGVGRTACSLNSVLVLNSSNHCVH